MTESLRRCKKCLLPETHETILFDDFGLCSVCTNLNTKQTIDWLDRRSKLNQIVGVAKSLARDYDCVVPFSGGKDSTFSLLFVVKELKLKPLVVSFDHGFYRSNLLRNRNRVLKQLGVDFLSLTPNWLLVKKLMLTSLYDKGDFCWHCHTGVAAFPVRVALEKNIPLIIWGESSTEYTNYFRVQDHHAIDEETFNRIANLGISPKDMRQRVGTEFSWRDYKPYTHPSMEEIREAGLLSFPLGNYIKWDTRSQVEAIKVELGWVGDEVEGVPPQFDYEKIECMMQGARDYLKFRKRGYARTTHLASIEIRNGRMSRDEGLDLVQEYEGAKPHSLPLLLQLLNVSEQDLEEIIQSQQIDPWDGPIPITIGKKPRDFAEWKTQIIP